MASEAKELYTVDEVADLLNQSPWMIRWGLREGRIRGHKPTGRQWRIRREEVERLLGGPIHDPEG